MARLVKYLVVLLLAGALTAATLVLVAPGLGAVLTAGEADPPEEIDLEPLAERSIVLAADGSRIGVLESENRTSVALDEVPDVVVETILAIEDRDFYLHDGINVRSMFRALVENVEAGDVEQGGSTITQQLVKNALLTPEQDLGRKVEEAVLARRLEQSMSKDEILERYLNTVFLGNRAYGIEAAAKRYYDVPVAQLTIEKAAFLAGLIRNPVGYDPLRRADAARGRRNVVLDRLVELGQLDRQAAALYKEVPTPTTVYDDRPPRDYFLEEVKRRLLRDERLGESPQEREDLLLRGGLTIRTTLDPRLQQAAQTAMAAQLPFTGLPPLFPGALASVEPSTGAVRALIGGPGFDQFEYNIATQGIGQQPGSSFKPIVLAAALDTGLITADDTIQGTSPCTFEVEDFPDQLGPDDWEVENYEGSRGSTGSIRNATAQSYNCAYARLLLLIGKQRVADMARRLGISTPIPDVASIALGSGDVYPLDMASAYGVFAAEGQRHPAYLVDEVVDRDGEVMFSEETVGEPVLTPELARTVTDVLTGVVEDGTGTAASLGIRPVAGKTGTSQRSSDAWFVGYTPQLSTAVWMGSPEGNIPMLNVGGRASVTGGSFPAAIWQAYMEAALDGEDIAPFGEPPEPPRPGQYLPVGPDDRPPPTSVPRRTYTRPYTPTTTTPPTTAPPPPPPPPAIEPPPPPAVEAQGEQDD